MATKAEELYAAVAELRMKAGKKPQPCGNVATGSKSRDQAAKKLGVGGRSVSKAKVVIAQGCQELQEVVRDGKVSVTVAEAFV